MGEVVSTCLSSVDAEAPGLVEGLYLVGSVALSDFRPKESDIDFVGVTSARPDPTTIDALGRVHAGLQALHPRPYFDGVYVTWSDLARNPDLAEPAPFAHDGQFEASGRFALDPVTWHTLARSGIAVRGPSADRLSVWTEPAVLTSWTLDNLESYWRPWRAGTAELFSADPEKLETFGAWASEWGVLGVTRLHYTLFTGEITSKEGAGLYGLSTFPDQWRTILNECLRIHRGREATPLYSTPLARWHDAVAYMDMIINDALSQDKQRIVGSNDLPTAAD